MSVRFRGLPGSSVLLHTIVLHTGVLHAGVLHTCTEEGR
jgi:hypothetical protein